MLILAVNTTSEAGGAALYEDEQCLASVSNDGPANKYSVSLFEMVERLLAEVNRRDTSPLGGLADIELYAVANGPGSFTGIRVGLAVAQAWATAFARPVKGISVLEAMVEAAQPPTSHALPILDAHRGEFYLGMFQKGAGARWIPAGQGLVLKQEALKRQVHEQLRAGQDFTVLARAHDQATLALRAGLPDCLRWRTVEGPLLEAIARIARRAAREGDLEAPGQLDAYYIRRTDAELNLAR